ncbi:MAG TPA: hypothetical protein DCM87_13600 [Planctomycetes bacterium]|nr:hypothetical protein [Planctomycetota bacterium]
MNDNHRRHLYATFRHIDSLLSEAERVLAAADVAAPFPAHTQDATPVQRKVIHADRMLDRIAALAGELGLSNLEPQIAACRRHVRGGERITVAVFGRFKAGKSSLLNHLVGGAVLPIGVVPVTAVVTRLRAGPEERAEVRCIDGAVRRVPLGDIGLYVGEQENPQNVKQVASVDVELPALQPLAPLEFVDTPGLGSVFAHNTDTVRQWLPNVGAALVAMSSDSPLSEPDVALIEELRRHTPRVALLLTKADLLAEEQRTEVLAFIRAHVRRKWGAEIPVFPYSVRANEGDFKAELVRNLLAPLIAGRREAAGQIARHKLRALAGQALDYLRVALAAATRAESSRRTLREKLDEERRQFDLLREEFRVLALRWSGDALDWSLTQLRPTEAALQAAVAAEFRTRFSSRRLRLPRLLDAWRDWLVAFLAAFLREVSRSERAMFCAPLHRVRQHLMRTLRAFQDRVAVHVEAALGVSLTPREFPLDVREPSDPPVDVAYAFDAAAAALAWLVPLTLFRRPIERMLLRKARWEAEKNLWRLAADWRDGVAAGIDELILQAERHALEELAALEHALAHAPAGSPALIQAIGDMEDFQRQLEGGGHDGARP